MIKKLICSKLFKSTSVYTVSMFINLAIPFFLLPILTHYLDAKEYGQLSMFNATNSFLMPFIGLSIGAAIGRKIIEGKESTTKEYIFNCLLLLCISTILASFLFFLFAEPIHKYTAVSEIFFPLIIITTVSSCLSNALLCYFQMTDQVKHYAVFRNLYTVLNVGLSILLVVTFNMGLKGRLYGISFSNLCFGVFAYVVLQKYIRGNNNRINRAFIKDELLNFAFPLIPVEIKSTVLTYTDRFFLTNMINLATTGVYSLGNQVSLPLLFIEQAFNLAFVPWLGKKLNENKYSERLKIVKMTYVYFIAVPIIAITWSFITKPLISIISGAGYEEAHDYVIWLSLSYAFLGMQMMVVNYVSYVKKLSFYAIVTIFIMILNVALNFFLIKKHGSIGAAQATMICSCISFLMTWILSMKVCPMPWFYFFKGRNL